jgi:hypothetical protein
MLNGIQPNVELFRPLLDPRKTGEKLIFAVDKMRR